MSLWSSYLNECGLIEIIEEDHGFIMFYAEGECLFINDMYVIPEKRQSGYGTSLVERAIAWGRDQGCTYVTTTIHSRSKCASEALKGALAIGFRVATSPRPELIMLVRLL